MKEINFPSVVDNTNFKYLKIDEKYIVSIIIKDYPKYTNFIQIISSIPKNINYDISINIKKEDTEKILKELTYKISSSTAEIKTINNNQVDIDILNNIKDDAISIRKEIQINNQEIFNMSIVITFYSYDYKELISKVKFFQSNLYSKSLISNLTNFRHIDSYLMSLPLKNPYNNSLLNDNLFTNDSLSLNFPFFKKYIFDKSGIIFGFTGKDNKLCNIDIFNLNYINSNMCILGSSGSGKSYFTKLLIVRHYLIGRRQFVFDVEGEYVYLAKKLEQKYINFLDENTYYYNIFQIFDYDLNTQNWFEEKVVNLTNLISKLSNLNSDKDIKIIKEAIINTYTSYNISNDKNTIYKSSTNNKIYIDNKIKDSYEFPTIIDLKNQIKNKRIVNIIDEEIIKKYKCISNISNVSFLDNLIVFNTDNMICEKNIELVKYFITEIKKVTSVSNYKNILYIDEIWKYICTSNDITNIIFEYYKTLRKQNFSIIAITQDINDFFNNDNYGKSIFNNSAFKLIFRIEYSDRKIIDNLNYFNNEDITKVYRLNKGQTFLKLGNNKIVLNIKASDYEKKIIEEG